MSLQFYNYLAERKNEEFEKRGLWKAAVNEKEKLTKDDAKFIFEQAEKFLKDSVESSETIVSRMNTLITIISGSLIALIGYIITKEVRNCSFDKTLIAPYFSLAYLYILAWLSFNNYKPRDYVLPGSLPEDLFNPSFFHEDIPREDRIIRYYVNEIENYQAKIEANSEINNQRWGRYTFIAKLLVALPLFLLVIYLFT